MNLSAIRGVAVVAVFATLALGIAACGTAPTESVDNTSKAATATSAADFGGMDALIAAAQEEGELNVIALPPDWANYGKIIEAFKAKYGLKVNSANPDGSSADEITAAQNLKGQSKAPDVFDLGMNVAMVNLTMFAPYKVETWETIPPELKDPNGVWVNDMGGYMSIGYDANKLPAPSTIADLLKPAYKGVVSMNGNPTLSGAGFNGVVMAALGSGGSADDVAPGVDFFAELSKAGNFITADVTPATIQSGQSPLVIDWDYLNVAQGIKLQGSDVDWQTVVPTGAVIGSFYAQAINKDAPHPAAARLWQEFIYSDEGQNFYLQGAARPARLAAMIEAGTADKAAVAALPKTDTTPVFMTQEQIAAATTYIAANWDKAVQ